MQDIVNNSQGHGDTVKPLTDLNEEIFKRVDEFALALGIGYEEIFPAEVIRNISYWLDDETK